MGLRRAIVRDGRRLCMVVQGWPESITARNQTMAADRAGKERCTGAGSLCRPVAITYAAMVTQRHGVPSTPPSSLRDASWDARPGLWPGPEFWW